MAQQKKDVCEGCARPDCPKLCKRYKDEGLHLCCQCYRMQSRSRFWDLLSKEFACSTCTERNFVCNKSICGNQWCEMFNWNDAYSPFCCVCIKVPDPQAKSLCDGCTKHKAVLESLAKPCVSPKVNRLKRDNSYRKRMRSYSDNVLNNVGHRNHSPETVNFR